MLECDENDKKQELVTICEGKYHQVKKMFLCCGLKVVHLQRISIGGLYLDSNLHIGECKLLTDLDKKSVFYRQYTLKNASEFYPVSVLNKIMHISLVNFGMVKLCEKWYIIVCNKAKDFIVID